MGTWSMGFCRGRNVGQVDAGCSAPIDTLSHPLSLLRIMTLSLRGAKERLQPARPVHTTTPHSPDPRRPALRTSAAHLSYRRALP